MSRLAIVQWTANLGDAAANREVSAALIGQAADRGAQVIVLPELAISGYTTKHDPLVASAEEMDGPTLALWRRLAASYKVIIAGGFCERENDKLFNAALLVGPDGLLLHYRKLHLFDQEKSVFAAGDRGLPVAATPFGRIGLCVCYDLRFVEVMRALALQNAEIVAVPTAWVRGFDPNPRDAAGLIGQVRSAAVQGNLNQVYVACASQAGTSGDVSFLGSSMISDPYGHLVAGPFGETEQRVEVVDIDITRVRDAQQRSPLVRPREDRRTDVYRLHLGELAL